MAPAPRTQHLPQAPPAVNKERRTNSVGTSSVISKAPRSLLLSVDEMPKWFQRSSNPWIIEGYRPISGSVSVSFGSWLYIHNESVNIYSHIIPAISFLLGERYVHQYLASRSSGVGDSVAFSVFMLAAVACLSLSATYHTLMNHSQKVERVCLRLDMLGVVVFILGDLVLGIYLIFWCELLQRNMYWFIVSYLHMHGFIIPVPDMVIEPNYSTHRLVHLDPWPSS